METNIGQAIDTYIELKKSHREMVEKFILRGIKIPKGTSVLVVVQLEPIRPIAPIISISVWNKYSQLEFRLIMRESQGLKLIKKRFKLLLDSI